MRRLSSNIIKPPRALAMLSMILAAGATILELIQNLVILVLQSQPLGGQPLPTSGKPNPQFGSSGKPA